MATRVPFDQGRYFGLPEKEPEPETSFPSGPRDNRTEAARAEAENRRAMYKDGDVLCLSGGGYRTAAYHVGAIRRMSELGLLSHIKVVRSVSGGSLVAGMLLKHLKEMPKDKRSLANLDVDKFEKDMVNFLSTDIRTWPFVSTLFLNMVYKGARVNKLVRRIERFIGDDYLDTFPHRDTDPECPVFEIMSSDVLARKPVRFTAGKTSFLDGRISLAQAVTASASFPPVFGPVPVRVRNNPMAPNDQNNTPDWDWMLLSDGGVMNNDGTDLYMFQYGNNVFISSGGAKVPPKHFTWRPRIWTLTVDNAARSAGSYTSAQAESLAQDVDNGSSNLPGIARWTIGHSTWEPGEGYEYPDYVADKIARIRTDLSPFGADELAILINHGYMRASAEIAKLPGAWLSVNKADGVPDRKIPHPYFRDIDAVNKALQGTNSRFYLRRGLKRLAGQRDDHFGAADHSDNYMVDKGEGRGLELDMVAYQNHYPH